MDNKHHEAQNEWQEATDRWVELTLEKYDGFESDDLTQVFMRGPFAGWSEYMVLELAMKLDESNKNLPRHSNDYWSKRGRDANGNQTYYENSDGLGQVGA
jgi:hypothetical protein